VRWNLRLAAANLGLRITYLATGPVTARDCDLAVPFAVEP
jgi:hypothetical protein